MGAEGASGTAAQGGGLDPEAFEKACDEALAYAVHIVHSPGWKRVAEEDGICLYKRTLQHGPKANVTPPFDGDDHAAAAEKFACVMARGILSARATDLFELLRSNDRVTEYNHNCAFVRDLEVVSEHAKVSWCCSHPVSIFQARDFVTAVSYHTLPDGTLAVVNWATDHPAAPETGAYVRGHIVIGLQTMRPCADDPEKSEYCAFSHVNPGGWVDNMLGSALVDGLVAQSGVTGVRALERAANASLKAPSS